MGCTAGVCRRSLDTTCWSLAPTWCCSSRAACCWPTCCAPGSLRCCWGRGLTVAIEAGQWLVLPGRHADARDIIANSAGALFGALLWLLLRTLRRRRAAARARTEHARRARRS
ncbi:VanZ family protein [Glutamicibacter creatinolyticus]|uniref:VanZ family protein n=1 Tax=Glutamicibacter creatinolyticus TaxID=162496 RepID=UPI0033D28F65